MKRGVRTKASVTILLAIIAMGLVFSTQSAAESLTWTQMAYMTDVRFFLGSAVLDGNIYAIGGHKSGSYLNSAEIYDPSTNHWAALPNMNLSRTYGAGSAAMGKVYVFGGATSGGSETKSVEAYDPVTQTWSFRADMAFARQGSAAALLGSEIYVIGGNTYGGGGYGQESIREVDIYDPSTNTWKPGPDLSAGRTWAEAVTVNDTLYVIGGRVNNAASGDVLVLNSGTNTWEVAASLNTPRFHFGTAVVDGKIYALGGFKDDTGTPVGSIEVYDPQLNTWQYLTSTMTAARGSFEAVALGRDIYVFGGEDWHDPNGNHALNLTERASVPEPATLVLIGIGIAGLLATPKRFRKQA